MKLQDFLQQDEHEQNIFISKLIHAIRRNEHCFQFANNLVKNAELDGMFSDVKFGSEVYSEVEKDLLVQQASISEDFI